MIVLAKDARTRKLALRHEAAHLAYVKADEQYLKTLDPEDRVKLRAAQEEFLKVDRLLRQVVKAINAKVLL